LRAAIDKAFGGAVPHAALRPDAQIGPSVHPVLCRDRSIATGLKRNAFIGMKGNHVSVVQPDSDSAIGPALKVGVIANLT
jgi:hypothetical protein